MFEMNDRVIERVTGRVEEIALVVRRTESVWNAFHIHKQQFFSSRSLIPEGAISHLS